MYAQKCIKSYAYVLAIIFIYLYIINYIKTDGAIGKKMIPYETDNRMQRIWHQYVDNT